MGSADPRIVEAILKARLQGNGPDSMQPHNPDWFGYKNYPEIFNGMDSGNHEGYMFQNEPDDQEHSYGHHYAQFQGRPQAPDVPSAREERMFDRGSPEMRKRFEDYFGTEAVNRTMQNVGPYDKSYVPTPRPRPGEAPVATPDDYIGDMPPQMPPFETQGPLPEEVYGYMPGLKDRVMEQNAGRGTAQDTKRDRLDGSRWDRSMTPFADQPTGNIQDLRLMAIEQMLGRGAATNPPEGQDMSVYQPPNIEPLQPPEMSIDDVIKRHLEDFRR